MILFICGIQRKGTNELVGKTEVKNKLWLPGSKEGRGLNWEIGIDIYTLLFKQKKLFLSGG